MVSRPQTYATWSATVNRLSVTTLRSHAELIADVSTCKSWTVSLSMLSNQIRLWLHLNLPIKIWPNQALA